MGREAKVTEMVLKVDLGCKKCYWKIKKVLCSTPQIIGQLFDDKSNTVTIYVTCCSPVNVANELREKGGETIKDINIKPFQPPSKPPVDEPRGGNTGKGGGVPASNEIFQSFKNICVVLLLLLLLIKYKWIA